MSALYIFSRVMSYGLFLKSTCAAVANFELETHRESSRSSVDKRLLPMTSCHHTNLLQIYLKQIAFFTKQQIIIEMIQKLLQFKITN